MSASKAEPRPPQEVEQEIRRLLDAPLADTELRDRLEEVAREPGFHGVPMTVWAHRLYERNRVVFRPFLLSHFRTFTWFRHKWKAIPWKGGHAAVLEPWLTQVDAAGDVELFRRLYTWKVSSQAGWRGIDTIWRRDLLARVRAAGTRHERQQVLARFDIGSWLDEPTAIEIYGLDPDAARRFVLSHLPMAWVAAGAKRTLWRSLYDLAGSGNDDAFALALFRRQASVAEWRKEIVRLCRDVLDPVALTESLEKRHLEGWLKLGPGFVELLTLRGRDAFPYVFRHLREMATSWLTDDGVKSLLALAAREQWWELWSAVLRTAGSQGRFDSAVEALVKDRARPEAEVRGRLALLSGVSREYNFGPWGFAQVHALSDRTAVEMYGRFPDLVRTAFKPHVGARWGKPYVDLVDAARTAGDEVLLDYLASRVLLVYGNQPRQLADLLSADLERLPAEDFARRAANVLSQVPAFSIPAYDHLLRENRLARLLFERAPASYLADPAAVRDLLEAPEIHAQALAFRVCALPDERAWAVARDNVDLLQAALLRPLHRRTRLLAFGALRNAATAEAPARRVLDRAREALDLPDLRYPKEKLVGLIGQILHRWPSLRGPREAPFVDRARVSA